MPSDRKRPEEGIHDLDGMRDSPHASGMWRGLTLLLVLASLSTAGMAEERPRGLLWNRSGLAATLPLQVKTDAAADHLLRLRDVETGQIVLAAYIRGGEPFRVLVPPGRYEVLFDTGTHWQGEATLFGADTQSVMLDRPLRFGASVSRKHGHLIDLRSDGDTVVRDFALCQRLALDFESVRRAKLPHVPSLADPRFPLDRLALHPPFRGHVPFPDPRYPFGGPHARPYPGEILHHRSVTPRYDLRARVCN